MQNLSADAFSIKNLYRVGGAWIFPEGPAIQEIQGECFAPCVLAWGNHAAKRQVISLYQGRAEDEKIKFDMKIDNGVIVNFCRCHAGYVSRCIFDQKLIQSRRSLDFPRRAGLSGNSRRVLRTMGAGMGKQCGKVPGHFLVTGKTRMRKNQV